MKAPSISTSTGDGDLDGDISVSRHRQMEERHVSAFKPIECGNVPFLHLAMSAIGYLSVETASLPSSTTHLAMSAVGYVAVEITNSVKIATALLDPDMPRPFPASSGFALLRDFRAPSCIQFGLNAETCLPSIWRCRLSDTCRRRDHV